MTTQKRMLMWAAVVLTAAWPLLSTRTVEAAENWLNLVDSMQLADAATKETLATDPAAQAPPGWTKPLPLSVGVEYAMVSDYVFRGINYSEYRGEGREKLNHQLGVWTEIDTKNFGVFGAYFWFEWYAAQDKQFARADHLLENDYIAYWQYAIAPIATTVELGWAAYVYPEYPGDFKTTYEVYAKVSFDDSKLFGTQSGVLNPYVSYYHDIDVVEAGWLEVGVSHDFALSRLPALAGVAVLKDVSVKPSLVLGMDHRYLPKALGTGQKATRLGNIVYGLDVTYNLSAALRLPQQFGSLTLGGFLYFSQALRDELINDELWGGMKVSYSW